MTKKCDYGVLDVFLVLNVIIEWFDDYIIPICQLYYVKKNGFVGINEQSETQAYS